MSSTESLEVCFEQEMRDEPVAKCENSNMDMLIVSPICTGREATVEITVETPYRTDTFALCGKCAGRLQAKAIERGAKVHRRTIGGIKI